MTDDAEHKFLIPARQFLELWRHAIELEAQLPEDMTDLDWFTKGKPTRTLIVDLSRAGEAAGILEPYVEGNPDGSFTFGTRVNPAFNLDDVVDLNAAHHWDYDTYAGDSLVSLASNVMGKVSAPTAAILKGQDAIYEMWEYLDWLKSHRPEKKDVADRAYKTFIDCAERAGIVEVNWQQLPDVRDGVDWEKAVVRLPPSFWADYLTLRLR